MTATTLNTLPANGQYFPNPIFNGKEPKEGPKALPVFYDFTANPAYLTDLTSVKESGKMSMVQSIFVDNTSNNEPVNILVGVTGQNISVPAGDQGIYPVLAASQMQFNVSSLGNGPTVQVQYINISMYSIEWTGLIGGSGGATQPVTDVILDGLVTASHTATSFLPVLTTPVQNIDADGSGAIVTGGSAQIIFVLNAARKGFMIQNIDQTILEPLYISTTGTATNSTGSFILQASPGAGYPGGFFQGFGSGAVSILGATTGHKFTAIQW